MVYPGATASVALAMVLYASWMGHYPSGAESGTTAVRIGILFAIASTYAGSTIAGRLRSDRRSLHDLATGLRVVEPIPAPIAWVPPPPRIPRPSTRPISRWWLAAVPPLVIVALAFGLTSIPIVVEQEIGPAIVGLGIAGSATHGVIVVVRRSIFAGRGIPAAQAQRKAEPLS